MAPKLKLNSKKSKVSKARKKTAEKAVLYLPRRVELGIKAALATKPVAGFIAIGPAGSGKSAKAHQIADDLKADFVVHSLSPGSREDDIIYNVVPDENTISGMKTFPGPLIQAARRSSGQDGRAASKVVLLLDEWDKTRPSTDSFLLDFLQYGRITYPGMEAQADLKNLVVILTMNRERAISEPLLRRLPVIDFPHPAPGIVRAALNDTHPRHPLLDRCVQLYVMGLAASLDKPPTIQELRQILDAVTTLGKEADWSTLVYQFATKEPDAHAKLMSVTKATVDLCMEQLKAAHNGPAGSTMFDSDVPDFDFEMAEYRGTLPKTDWEVNKEFDVDEWSDVEMQDVTFSCPFQGNYAKLAELRFENSLLPTGQLKDCAISNAATDDPALLTDFEVVEYEGSRIIISSYEFALRNMSEWRPLLLDLTGAEAKITEPSCTYKQFIEALKRWVNTDQDNPAKVQQHKISQEETVLTLGNSPIRWSADDGMEAIVRCKVGLDFLEFVWVKLWSAESITSETPCPNGALGAREWKRIRSFSASALEDDESGTTSIRSKAAKRLGLPNKRQS